MVVRLVAVGAWGRKRACRVLLEEAEGRRQCWEGGIASRGAGGAPGRSEGTPRGAQGEEPNNIMLPGAYGCKDALEAELGAGIEMSDPTVS